MVTAKRRVTILIQFAPGTVSEDVFALKVKLRTDKENAFHHKAAPFQNVQETKFGLNAEQMDVKAAVLTQESVDQHVKDQDALALTDTEETQMANVLLQSSAQNLNLFAKLTKFSVIATLVVKQLALVQFPVALKSVEVAASVNLDMSETELMEDASNHHNVAQIQFSYQIHLTSSVQLMRSSLSVEQDASRLAIIQVQ
jgi:hypothetical protein